MATNQSPVAGRIAIISLIAVCALLVLAIIAALRLPTFRPYVVAGISMEPTLYQGDKILVNQDYYARHAPEDGDLVVFRHGDALLIKRISALAGETIEGKNGKLIRNGVELVEPYAENSKDNSLDIETFPQRQVPEGEIFVTGDSRDHSLDSRTAEYGPVHTRDVVGRVAYVYWHSRRR
jgi:signal peptidase I